MFVCVCVSGGKIGSPANRLSLSFFFPFTKGVKIK